MTPHAQSAHYVDDAGSSPPMRSQYSRSFSTCRVGNPQARTRPVPGGGYIRVASRRALRSSDRNQDFPLFTVEFSLICVHRFPSASNSLFLLADGNRWTQIRTGLSAAHVTSGISPNFVLDCAARTEPILMERVRRRVRPESSCQTAQTKLIYC